MTKQIESISSDLAAFALANDLDGFDTVEGANRLIRELETKDRELLNKHGRQPLLKQLQVLELADKKLNRAAFFVATNLGD